MHTKSCSKNKSGFGIIEILFSVIIVALLTAIILLFIPAKNDAVKKQQKDIQMISKAIQTYSVENGGKLPANITEKSVEICKTHAVTCRGLVDLAVLTQNEKYLVSMPVNPRGESENGVGYTIKKDANGKVVVMALNEI